MKVQIVRSVRGFKGSKSRGSRSAVDHVKPHRNRWQWQCVLIVYRKRRGVMLENSLRAFQTCCETFPLLITVRASVCQGLSRHSPLWSRHPSCCPHSPLHPSSTSEAWAGKEVPRQMFKYYTYFSYWIWRALYVVLRTKKWCLNSRNSSTI